MKYEVALVEDVLIEVLIRLPVESLMRFRCVSKYWCALIRSPSFITTHLKRDCKNERILLKRKHPQGKSYVLSHHCLDSPHLLVSPSLSLPLVHNLIGKECYDFFGTCNGLVCLAFKDMDLEILDIKSAAIAVVLCNPALREFKVLDPTPFVCPEGYIANVLGWGFGFDANNNAYYKVVQRWEIVNTHDDDDLNIRVDLYDSSTNCWRLIDDEMVPKDTYINHPASNLFFNGAFHWEASTKYILSFNLSTEVFQELEFPDLKGVIATSLLVYNQCLSLVHFTGWSGDPTRIMDIWVMKEYGVNESWTKELVLGPCVLRNPLLFLKNKWLLVQTHDRQLVCCALHRNEVKKCYFYTTREAYMQAVIFTESLISLK